MIRLTDTGYVQSREWAVMGCCGDNIKKGISIVEGYVLYNYDVLFRLPRPKYEFADGRIRVCQKCDKQTWMSKREYMAWLKDNARDVIKKLDQLEILPELPKYGAEHGKNLFCMVCKCFVPAKAYTKEEKCPLNKWPVNTN